MVIAVIDGMGGGIGAQIILSLREELPTYIDIYALGTNSIATSAMMKSHANKGEALKILLPIMPENFSLVGVENKPLSLLIKDTIKVIKKEFNIK